MLIPFERLVAEGRITPGQRAARPEPSAAGLVSNLVTSALVIAYLDTSALVISARNAAAHAGRVTYGRHIGSRRRFVHGGAGLFADFTAQAKPL